LASIGKSHKPHIGQYLQLKDDPFFFSGFARLCMLRCLVCGGGEKKIAFASASTGCENEFFTIFGDLTHYFICFGSPRYSAQRHLNNFIFAGGAGAVLCFTWFAIFSNDVLAVFQVKQRPELSVSFQDNITPTAAIAAIRSALGIEFFSMKMKTSCTAAS